MLAIIFSLYGVVFLVFAFIYFFIVYHLVKYSIDIAFSKIILLIFTVISALLLFSNMLLFFSVDWKTLFEKIIPF